MKRNLVIEALDVPKDTDARMGLWMRIDAAFARNELSDPCTLPDLLRVADAKDWPIKADVRKWAERERILEKPKAADPLPWESPVTPTARTAAARAKRSQHAI